MSKQCSVSSGEKMILACSGGSNVGQLSNRAAVELTREGFGKMFCLAGIGGQLPGFLKSARETPVIALDGCAVGCARAILANAELTAENYLVLTDLGIEKNKDLEPGREQIDLVKDAVRRLSAATAEAGSIPMAGGCSCGCGGGGR